MNKPNTNQLRLLAMYLEGLKEGKGNLLPMGNIVLDELWNAIIYIDDTRQ